LWRQPLDLFLDSFNSIHVTYFFFVFVSLVDTFLSCRHSSPTSLHYR
jgi:hypothetical protein